jgi:predicted glutamine amidotransferase
MFALACDAEFRLSVRFRQPEGRAAYREEGWGVGVIRDRAAVLLREPEARPDPATAAALADGRLLRGHTAVGYIRRWTHSAALANCHPFCRAAAGTEWLFAHNGALAGLEGDPAFAPRTFRPVGGTDSERAFCALLDTLAAAEEALAEHPPGSADRAWAVAHLLHPRSVALSRHGTLNYVLAGEGCLLAFSSGQYGLYGWAGSPPAPWVLEDADWRVEVHPVAGPVSAAVAVASDAMGQGGWRRLETHEMLVVAAGRLLGRVLGAPGRVEVGGPS